MTALGVATDDDRYRIAIAELTASTASVADVAEADIVVGSRVPESRAHQLVIISTERGLTVDPPLGSTAVLERPWFRSDVEQDVEARRGWFPRIEVEVTAPASELHAVLTDAVAWTRTLASAEVQPGAGGATRVGGIAEARAGETVVTLQVRRRETGAAALRVTGVGPRRIEISVDDDRRSARVRIADEDGELALPERWEDPARVALRRAVHVRRSGVAITEIDDYRRDAAIAARLLRLINEGDDENRQPRIP
jgi:hypothetical protein